MSEGNPELDAVQDHLEVLAEDLKAIEKRAKALSGRLPAPSAEKSEGEGEEDNDVATEIRSVIECVLTDSLGPAIRDFQAAAAYGRKRKG